MTFLVTGPDRTLLQRKYANVKKKIRYFMSQNREDPQVELNIRLHRALLCEYFWTLHMKTDKCQNNRLLAMRQLIKVRELENEMITTLNRPPPPLPPSPQPRLPRRSFIARAISYILFGWCS